VNWYSEKARLSELIGVLRTLLLVWLHFLFNLKERISMTRCPNCNHDFQSHINDASTPLDFDNIARSKHAYRALYRESKYGWIDSVFWLVLFLVSEIVVHYEFLYFIPLMERYLLFCNAIFLFQAIINWFNYQRVKRNLPFIELRYEMNGFNLEELHDVPKFTKIKPLGYSEEFLGQPS